MPEYVENCVCESCEFVGLCIRLADDCVLCETCFATHEEIATQIEDEISRDEDCIHIDEIDDGSAWDDFADSEYDSAYMYGRDDDNPVALGAYDE